MSAATLLLLAHRGAPMAANTAVATIDTAPVIGTALDYTPGTWTGSTAVSAQAMRCTTVDGTYASVGSAWDSILGTPYTPVDGDFGYFFRVDETATPGDVEATGTANASRCAEAPSQSLGSELVSNSDLNAWTGDNPDGWIVGGESGSDPMVTQVASGGGAGTGAARLYSSATNNAPAMQYGALLSSRYNVTHWEGNISANAAGQIRAWSADGRGGLGATPAAFSGTGVRRGLVQTSQLYGSVQGISTAPIDFVIDGLSIKVITHNPELTALSANMRVDFLYTLPGSPVDGTGVWLVTRSVELVNAVTPNPRYWRAIVDYTGSQWNIRLESLDGAGGTARIIATNIGVSDGVRVNMNGDSISLYTSANGGGSWTQRGSTISNSTHNTATGVTSIWTSDVTPGQLRYAPAD